MHPDTHVYMHKEHVSIYLIPPYFDLPFSSPGSSWFIIIIIIIIIITYLLYCATNQKVAGSIPDGVIGIFHWHKSFWSHYGPGVDSTYNRNEYQVYFLGVNAAGA
jgi:hypothetical protein